MPLSDTSMERLSQVAPELSRRIRQLDAIAPGLDLQVTQGFRTWKDQDALYAKGRNGNAGPIVTDAPAGYSWHNYALAVDVVPEDVLPGQPDWNLQHPAWKHIVAVAATIGCGD